jgi:glycosyltransferase involved in cell wall biosynthesis
MTSVSVLIFCEADRDAVAASLSSVQAQTLAPIETLLVDEAGTAARNAALGRARGDWVAFLEAGDLWDPRKLELQAALAAARPGCRAVHCGVTTLRADGSAAVRRASDVGLDDLLVFPSPIAPSAPLVDRQALLECGLFDPTLRCCHDLDLFLRFCFEHGRVHAVPEPLVTHREGGPTPELALLWQEADRVYGDFLPLCGDARLRREVLPAVYAHLAARALTARQGALLGEMLRRATRSEVSLTRLLAGVGWRVLLNRLRR